MFSLPKSFNQFCLFCLTTISVSLHLFLNFFFIVMIHKPSLEASTGLIKYFFHFSFLKLMLIIALCDCSVNTIVHGFIFETSKKKKCLFRPLFVLFFVLPKIVHHVHKCISRRPCCVLKMDTWHTSDTKKCFGLIYYCNCLCEQTKWFSGASFLLVPNDVVYQTHAYCWSVSWPFSLELSMSVPIHMQDYVSIFCI